MDRQRLCFVAELPNSNPLKVTLADGTILAVVKFKGGIAVVDEKCPHQGAPLSQSGEIEEDVLECVWHRCRFELRAGKVIEGRCTTPLKLLPCEIDGDAVYLKTAE